MTDSMTLTRPRRPHPRMPVDLDDIEMTLTDGEWHLYRDTADDVWVVVPHEQQLDLAA